MIEYKCFACSLASDSRMLSNIHQRTAITTMTRDAYGQAYHQGFDMTVRFLISRGVPSEPARDAAQAAWVRGWERLSQLRNESMVVTWVNTIAMNVHRSVLRSERSCQALAEHAQPAEINLAAIDVARILKYCRPRDRAL